VIDREELRRWVAGRTPGRWNVGYWPTPDPYYWVGVIDDENPLSSRMKSAVSGPLHVEADAKLFALAPRMAEELIAAERFHDSVCDCGDAAGHLEEYVEKT
jgi:hypothetical protein